MKRINNLINKAQKLKTEQLEPEMLEKLEQAQQLLSEIYRKSEKRMKGVLSDYSFLARDHVFFDGDHINHSGAV